MALNKTALASSTKATSGSTTYFASNAIDGSTSSLWTANTSNPNEWLMVDLGSTSTICCTEVMWQNTGVYKYKVEVSNDNASWTQVVNQTGNSASKQTFTDYFTQTTGRYVRITATGLPSGSASIYEFRVFSPFPDPIKWYRLVFLHSNMVLKNLMESPMIMQSGFSNELFQEWQLLPAATQGYYKIQNSSMSVLDNTNGVIDANASTGGANQQFKLFPSSKSGYYYLVEKGTGKAVEVTGSSLVDGATLDENTISTKPPNSTSDLGCANQLIKLEDATPWNQTQFIIGSYLGPLFDANDLNDYKAANFNTIIDIMNTDQSNFSFTNSTFMLNPPEIKLSSYDNNLSLNLPRFTDYQYMAPSASNVPMEECLSLIKNTGGLKMLIWNGYYYRNAVDQQSILYDVTSVRYNWPIINSDNQCAQDVINTATVYKNYSQYRAQMLGYFIEDEPDLSLPNYASRVNLIKDNLAAADPGMLGFINLSCYWTGAGTWNDYGNQVESYIASPNTKVVSFDYYCLATDGYLVRDPTAGYCTYFSHLNLFASAIQYYQSQGKQTIFWGSCGHSCEETNYSIPTGQTLRYYASTSLIYGSKAMIWYSYCSTGGNLLAIQNNTAIYDTVQRINGELKTMWASSFRFELDSNRSWRKH